MRTTSALYQTIVAGTHHFEVKVNIDGVDYGEDVLVSVSTSIELFDKILEVGAAVCGSIKVVMLTPAEQFSRMAQIKPYVRAVNSTQQSEWIQKGLYYIDTRTKTNNIGSVNTLTITGYDAMLMAEQDLCTTDESSSWPKTDTAAVNQICTKLGVGLDARTSFDGYSVAFPGYQASALSCRQVLANIAALYGGWFVMNDVGELRLIRLGDLPEDSYRLIDENENYITVGGEYIDVR